VAFFELATYWGKKRSPAGGAHNGLAMWVGYL
jgi:hypothetical protein